MKYTEEEKKAMADVDKLSFLLDDVYSTGLVDDQERDEYVKSIQMVLDLLEKKNKELEMYKRIAEMNLKDGEEFKKEMCEHRCILKSDLEEKDKLICFNKKYINELEQDLFENTSNYVVSKEAIRKKIKEIDENGYWDFLEERDCEKTINILKELLGDE